MNPTCDVKDCTHINEGTCQITPHIDDKGNCTSITVNMQTIKKRRTEKPPKQHSPPYPAESLVSPDNMQEKHDAPIL